MTMFYVTTTENVGPNQNDNNHGEPIATISTEPSRTNSSGEIRVDGWLGQNNDWTSHAWGQFECIEAARELCKLQGWTEAIERPEHSDDTDEHYTTKRAVAEHWDADQWYSQAGDCDLTGDETDEAIEARAKADDDEAREQGCGDGPVIVNGSYDYLISVRDGLKEKAAA